MGTDSLAGLLRVDVKKGFCTVRMVKQWNRFQEKFSSHFPWPHGVNGSLLTSGDEWCLQKG